MTVLYNNEYLVGLRFAYVDKTMDTVSGTGDENIAGPLRSVELRLEEEESIVGVTVDQC